VGDGKLEIGSIDPGYANGESKDRDGEKPFPSLDGNADGSDSLQQPAQNIHELVAGSLDPTGKDGRSLDVGTGQSDADELPFDISGDLNAFVASIGRKRMVLVCPTELSSRGIRCHPPPELASRAGGSIRCCGSERDGCSFAGVSWQVDA
jgi:hypothetical protein